LLRCGARFPDGGSAAEPRRYFHVGEHSAESQQLHRISTLIGLPISVAENIHAYRPRGRAAPRRRRHRPSRIKLFQYLVRAGGLLENLDLGSDPLYVPIRAGQDQYGLTGFTASMRAMKAMSIIAVLLLVAVNALALLPAANVFQPYLSGGALVLGLVVLVTILAGRSSKRDGASAAANVIRPVPVSAHAPQADAEIVSFLAMLQAKGRLIDFLMDDINAHDDAQVGAAARVVHAGCKAALQEHFRIRPLLEKSEGSTVQVPAGYRPDEYRLIGKISGPAPFSGVLVHHGWKTDMVKLPRVLRGSTDRLPAIAPAEVELK
jgi:Domain of unknown function (DUF2760)